MSYTEDARLSPALSYFKYRENGTYGCTCTYTYPKPTDPQNVAFRPSILTGLLTRALTRFIANVIPKARGNGREGREGTGEVLRGCKVALRVVFWCESNRTCKLY